MTKSELIERIAQKQTQLAYRDVELAVKTILEHMAERLASGDRIEIRAVFIVFSGSLFWPLIGPVYPFSQKLRRGVLWAEELPN